VGSARPALSIGLFGPTTAVVDGRPIDLGPRKHRAILAVLALSAGHVVAVERLIDAVWGAWPPDSARNAVQVYVGALRKALPAGAIRTQDPGYVLDCPSDAVDVLRFERLVAERTNDALALWTGDPLADLDDLPFSGVVATRLAELRLHALEDGVDLALERGRHRDVAPQIEALLLDAPYHERLWRQLMLAYYRDGRQADALSAFQRARRVLDEQLGIDPGPALVALERAILAQDPGLDAAPSSDSRPLPPLPPILSPTTGREGLLDKAAAVVVEHRLTTLLGPGGVGKTRTAQELAHRMVDVFADGVVFVDLSHVRDERACVAELARAVGASGDQEDWVAIAAALHGRRLLVVLDNLEQLPTAPEIVARLLATSGPHVVATTRIALGLVAERVVSVAPLGAVDSVTLLADRIVAAGAPPAAPAVVQSLAERLDGLPLAIELVAASCRSVGPEAVLDMLARRVHLPTGPRDVPERQRTMQALVDWSLDLLGEEERALLDAVAEFAAPFTIEATSAMADHADKAPTLLARLVESSLVLREEGRFRLLQPVREHLGDLLHDDVAAMLHERHTRWVIALTKRAGHDLYAGDGVATLARVHAAFPDLRLAFDRLVSADKHEEAARVVLDVIRAWFLAGRLREAEEALARVAGHDALTPRTAAEVTALRGIFTRLTGDGAAGGELLREGLSGLREHAPSSIALVNALCHYADDRIQHGESAEAVALADEAIAAARRTSDAGSVSMALDLAGYVARAVGDQGRAVAAAREAVEVARGEPSGLADALAGLAASLGPDDPEGVAFAWEAIAVAASAGVPNQLARVALTVADVTGPGDPATTATMAAQSLATYLAMSNNLALDAAEALAALGCRIDAEAAAQLLGAVRRRSGGRPDTDADLGARLASAVGRDGFAKALGQGAALDDDALGRLGAEVASRVAAA
jgi:DNA-binding SARP family transcriptional activator/predicted ATPase